MQYPSPHQNPSYQCSTYSPYPPYPPYQFPHLYQPYNVNSGFDDNYIYKLNYSRGDTGYCYCINKNIKNIKCSARRIY